MMWTFFFLSSDYMVEKSIAKSLSHFYNTETVINCWAEFLFRNWFLNTITTYLIELLRDCAFGRPFLVEYFFDAQKYLRVGLRYPQCVDKIYMHRFLSCLILRRSCGGERINFWLRALKAVLEVTFSNEKWKFSKVAICFCFSDGKVFFTFHKVCPRMVHREWNLHRPPWEPVHPKVCRHLP